MADFSNVAEAIRSSKTLAGASAERAAAVVRAALRDRPSPTPTSRRMQADDFGGSRFLWVERGEKLWQCAGGHGAGRSVRGRATATRASSMRGAADAISRVERSGAGERALQVEGRIQRLPRGAGSRRASARARADGSARRSRRYVARQSRGMPILSDDRRAGARDIRARPRLYLQRRGADESRRARTCHTLGAQRHDGVERQGPARPCRDGGEATGLRALERYLRERFG